MASPEGSRSRSWCKYHGAGPILRFFAKRVFGSAALSVRPAARITAHRNPFPSVLDRFPKHCRMAIIEDYAAIASELRRIRAERQLERAEMAVPIGVLRAPTRYSCGAQAMASISPGFKERPGTIALRAVAYG